MALHGIHRYGKEGLLIMTERRVTKMADPYSEFFFAAFQEGKMAWREEINAYYEDLYWGRMGSDKSLKSTVEPYVTSGGNVILPTVANGKPAFLVIGPEGSVKGVRRARDLTLTGKKETITRTKALFVTHWYGNNFLSWGYHVVKDTKGNEKEVFLLDKLRMERLDRP
jgi:hypothetical protein